MKQLIEQWGIYLAAQEYAPNTIELYGSAIAEFFRSSGIADVQSVTADDVERWMLDHASWSPVTKKWHYAAVRGFFTYLVNKKLIPEDPSTILPKVNVKRHIDESADTGKEDRVYTTEQLISMLEFDDVRDKKLLIRDRAIIALMAATGMRASEICWLNVEQILNRKGNTIFALRKGQNIRKITVSEFAFRYIEEYLDSRDLFAETNQLKDAPLFVTRSGVRVNRHDIYNLLAKRQKELGIRTGTHNIRYTVLNAIDRNASPVVARDIAGQKSIAITNNYLVSSEDERRNAVAALPWAETMKNIF